MSGNRKRSRLLSVAGLAVGICFFVLLGTGCQDRQSVTPAPSPVKQTESASETTPTEFRAIIAPLIDFKKLDTLKGERAANPRLRKICYWLEAARRWMPRLRVMHPYPEHRLHVTT